MNESHGHSEEIKYVHWVYTSIGLFSGKKDVVNFLFY